MRHESTASFSCSVHSLPGHGFALPACAGQEANPVVADLYTQSSQFVPLPRGGRGAVNSNRGPAWSVLSRPANVIRGCADYGNRSWSQAEICPVPSRDEQPRNQPAVPSEGSRGDTSRLLYCVSFRRMEVCRAKSTVCGSGIAKTAIAGDSASCSFMWIRFREATAGFSAPAEARPHRVSQFSVGCITNISGSRF